MTTPRELYNRGAIRIVKNPQAVPVYDVHIGRECFQIPADKFYEAADASDEEVRKIFGLEGLYRGRIFLPIIIYPPINECIQTSQCIRSSFG